MAIIGTGRIGLAMIKKCAGFDMNILCFDPAYENHDYIKAIQETNDLRFQRGISREKTWIRYTTLMKHLSAADFVSLHVPLLREGESSTPTYHLINETTLRMMKPTAMVINTSRGPVIDETALARALARELDRWRGARCLRKRAAPRRFAVARSRDRRSLPVAAAFRQRGAYYAAVSRS